jgi:hypothetical protein
MPLTRLVPTMIRQATARLLGRSTAGAGETEEIAVGSGLSLVAGTLSSLALGYGQTWQNLTGSRALGVTYTNTTGRPIFVSVYGVGSPNNGILSATVDGVVIGHQGFGAIASGVSNATITFVVPAGSTYRADNINGATLNAWCELR